MRASVYPTGTYGTAYEARDRCVVALRIDIRHLSVTALKSQQFLRDSQAVVEALPETIGDDVVSRAVDDQHGRFRFVQPVRRAHGEGRRPADREGRVERIP